MLERDSNGYLIYSPCDGSTPEIIIKNDSLTIQWQLEKETYKLKKILKQTTENINWNVM